MKRPVFFITATLILLLFTSCEAFFTYNWFQAAANLDSISVDEAISSGDPAVMKVVYDRIVAEAASASGSAASDLYLQAADLALGISGMSDPSILLSAPQAMSGGGVNDIFAIITDTGLDLNMLENVSALIASADTADPGSVPADMWLFAAAGSAATIAIAAETAGQPVDTYLPADPMTDPDVQNTMQNLVNAIYILPTDIADQLWGDQTNLESYGIVFPP